MLLRLSGGEMPHIAGILRSEGALTRAPFSYSVYAKGRKYERAKRRREFPLVINVSVAEHRSTGVREGQICHNGCPHLTKVAV